MSMRPATLAFVDDHPVLLSGMCQLFSALDGFNVVAVGKSAQDAVEISYSHAPDVIVVDLNMPGRTLEAIAKVASGGGSTRFVVFTASNCIDTAIAALEAGASGYVLKGSTIEELTEAIGQVLNGETYITPSFATKVVAGLRQAARRVAQPRVVFSKREEDVLRLLLRGHTNKEIAEGLLISDKTVKHYVTVLIQKLHVRNRVEVVLAAQELASSGALPPGATIN